MIAGIYGRTSEWCIVLIALCLVLALAMSASAECAWTRLEALGWDGASERLARLGGLAGSEHARR